MTTHALKVLTEYAAPSISMEDDHGLTQKQPAQMAGIAPTVPSGLLRLRRDMRIGNLSALADAMD